MRSFTCFLRAQMYKSFDANAKGGVSVASLFYLAWGQPLSDLGNSNRLAQTYSASLRFVKGLGWFRWSTR